MTWLIVFFLVGVVLSAFYSGSETGVYAVNRLRLELRAESPVDKAARTLNRLIKSREALLCVLLLGNNIANEATTILAERIVSEFLSDSRFSTLVTAAVLTPLLFVFGEALPKQMFRMHAETWSYRFAPYLQGSRVILTPLWLLVLPVARLANRLASGRVDSFRHDEFALERLLSSAGTEVDPVREAALGIGSRHRAPVREVMIPLDRARYLPADATIEDVRSMLGTERHSRYPVQGSDGAFESYVYFLDAFTQPREQRSVGEVSRPLAVLAPESPLDHALDVLENDDARVAVVRDASSATLGFVFAADVVAGLLSMEKGTSPGA